MAEETTTAVAEPQATEPAQSAVAADPFALDENSLASLSPEQRASLDPILDSWKKRASEEITKRESSAAEKYKPMEEKAQALEKLTNYAPFVQWWQQQQNAQMQANPQAGQAIQNTQPSDVASQTEWQEAIYEASQGNGQKLAQIQARMTAAWATPFVQQMTQKQQMFETQMAVRDIFESHPEAKTLDGIKTKSGETLLEIGLEWAERNNRPLEEGFQRAKDLYDDMGSRAKQEAMGMVTGKKQDVTSGPSTSNAGLQVIEVDNQDELIKRSMDAQLNGQKVQFVIRKK